MSMNMHQFLLELVIPYLNVQNKYDCLVNMEQINRSNLDIETSNIYIIINGSIAFFLDKPCLSLNIDRDSWIDHCKDFIDHFSQFKRYDKIEEFLK